MHCDTNLFKTCRVVMRFMTRTAREGWACPQNSASHPRLHPPVKGVGGYWRAWYPLCSSLLCSRKSLVPSMTEGWPGRMNPDDKTLQSIRLIGKSTNKSEAGFIRVSAAVNAGSTIPILISCEHWMQRWAIIRGCGGQPEIGSRVDQWF